MHGPYLTLPPHPTDTHSSALALALKMHQGDSTASLAPRLAALSSLACALTPRALCELEFGMVGALGRYLNPPTPGTMIHHLLHFLPRDAVAASSAGGGASSSHKNNHRPLLLALDDHANDLALMALETPQLAAFPVSVVAVAAILASFSRIRADGANKWLDPELELRWLEALDANRFKVRGWDERKGWEGCSWWKGRDCRPPPCFGSPPATCACHTTPHHL